MLRADPAKGLRLLYLAEADSGGIAEYALYQANALQAAGLSVTVLCRPDFPQDRLVNVRSIAALPPRPKGSNVLSRAFNYVFDSRAVAKAAFCHICATKADYLLIDCFREYLAPLWTAALYAVRRTGVRIGVMAHDPVRNFVIGPDWWHNLCIRNAYGFVDDVYVHDAAQIDFGGPRPCQIRVHTVTHGPFIYSPAKTSRTALRAGYGFGEEDCVLLSFGQIRDGKNLDQVIRSLASLPGSVKLLVAGSGGAKSQKPPLHYQKLAEALGVHQRCKWELRYIKDAEVGGFFLAADMILLVYSRDFVSASGVLNIAVQFNRPVLGSGGDGPLKRAIQAFPIGEWVEDPTPEKLAHAILRMTAMKKRFSFEKYLESNSWQENARIIATAIAAWDNCSSEPAESRCMQH